MRKSLNRLWVFSLCCFLVGGLLLASCSGRDRRGSSSNSASSNESPLSQERSAATTDDRSLEMSEAFFNSLVDTVSCQYLCKYLNKMQGDKEISNRFRKPYRKESDLEKILEEVKQVNPNLGITVSNVRNLWAYIDSKRDKYEEHRDDSHENLIAFLVELPSDKPGSGKNCFKEFLKETTASLEKQLNICLEEGPVETAVESEDTEMEDASEPEKDYGECKSCGKKLTKSGKEFCSKSCEKEYKKSGNKEQKSSKVWLYFLSGVLLGAVASGIVLRKRYKTENEQLSDQIKSERYLREKGEINIQNLQKQIGRLQADNRRLEDEKQRFFEENVSLGEEMDRLKGGELDKGGTSATSAGQSQTPVFKPVLYADAIVDGSLMRVKEVEGEDSVFELHLNSSTPNIAEFVICGRARQRVVANPSFIEGCECQVLPNATNIEIIAPGIAQKDPGTGKWTVSEKLKINIR